MIPPTSAAAVDLTFLVLHPLRVLILVRHMHAVQGGLRNPFHFRHVQHLKGASQFDDSGPCVMMATPSMLQSGMSRDLFEAWCEDERNTVIIADFAVQGTLAREILSNPSHVVTKAGVRVSHGMGACVE